MGEINITSGKQESLTVGLLGVEIIAATVDHKSITNARLEEIERRILAIELLLKSRK